MEYSGLEGYMCQLSISSDPRKRLSVHPLLWTPLHLSLLSCEFANRGAVVVEGIPEPEEPPKTKDDREMLEDVERFFTARVVSPSHTRDVLEELIGGLECRSERIELRFGGRTTADLRIVSFNHAESLPQLGYINLTRTHQDKRRALVGGPPPTRADLKPSRHRHRPVFTNMLASHRTKKLLHRLNIDDLDEDPYIAAVLIALAQKQRHYLLRGEKASQMVLASKSCIGRCDNPRMHIYACAMSTAFIDALQDPNRPLPAESPTPVGITIHHQRLPLKPYSTLAKRLQHAVRETHASLTVDNVGMDLSGPDVAV
ncbi:hypothetical protein QBC34DRAFT_441729 [Podospora aff. communis PSN243]|uniref:Uncharacterized protein n=1 Tax=Podospora aff. communis PSN243 TaxID=3040156 RepID=A0AAV9GA78_9PEZI|nr:hypothetical protein QBC34DRAFT_441729 [Podospora aff. communis PSN243]